MTREEVKELFKDWKSEMYGSSYLAPDDITLSINPDIEYYRYPISLNDEQKDNVRKFAANSLKETYAKYFTVDESGLSTIFYGNQSIRPIHETVDLKPFFEEVLDVFESKLINLGFDKKLVYVLQLRFNTSLYHEYKMNIKEVEQGGKMITCFGKSLVPWRTEIIDLRAIFKMATNLFLI